MRDIITVARYTFLEGIRARFFIGVIVVSIAIVIIGTSLASFPFGSVDQLMGRLGWGAIFLTGLAISSLFAIQYSFHERDVRILNLMLTKPLPRWQYAVGKYFGILAMTKLTVLFEGLVLMGCILIFGQDQHAFLWEWILPAIEIISKCAALLAFAMLFATLMYPLAATIATFAYYFVGVGSQGFLVMAQKTNVAFLEVLATVLVWLAPHFNQYDVSGWIIHDVAMTPQTYAFGFIYFLGYVLIGLILYVTVFEVRELK